MLLVFLFIPLVSSNLVIKDTFDKLYNVGDLIEVNFSIVKDYDASGFVEVILDCDDEFILKKDYISLEENVKKYIYLESPLALDGDCNVEISFLNDLEKSIEFKVSDRILIDYTLNDRFFLPFEKVIINGTVEKENGENYNGLLKVKILNLDEKSVEVNDGNFYFEYEIKLDSSPQEYVLEFIVEERNFQDKIINSGGERDKIEIRPKATYLEIKSIEEVIPPFEFEFEVVLLDQIRRKFENETIVIKLINPLGDIIFQKEILAGENISYNFTDNAMKGGWAIKSFYANLFSVKSIYVDENKKIDGYLLGNVLYFENLGNVPYEGVIGFVLSNESFEDKIYLNISVPVGETVGEYLNYQGEYNLTLEGEDYGTVNLTGSHLTGYSILGDFEITSRSYFVAGGVLIFLFLVWFFIFKKKVFRKLGKNESSKFIKEQDKYQKQIKEIQTKKLIVQETLEENKPVLRKNYMLFLESSLELENFRGIIENYKFKLNLVEDKLGYVLFFDIKDMNSELKAYNLAKAIMRFSDMKEAKTSIVINRGMFENKLTLLKKFALLNRKLLVHSSGKILMTKKFFDFLKIGVVKEIKKVNVLDRDLEICLV